MRPIGIVYILKEPGPTIDPCAYFMMQGSEKTPSMQTLVILPVKYEMYHISAVHVRPISFAIVFTRRCVPPCRTRQRGQVKPQTHIAVCETSHDEVFDME